MHESRVPAVSISPQHHYYTSTYAGVTGEILLSESIPGGINKEITIVLAGYTSTTDLTIVYPAPFTATPVTARAVNPGFSPTVTSTTTVIPARASTTDGTIIIIGA